jgi:hypothetical protein
VECRCRRRGEGLKEEAYFGNETGEGGKCVVCEQACRGSNKKNSVAKMIICFSSGHIVVLRTTF